MKAPARAVPWVNLAAHVLKRAWQDARLVGRARRRGPLTGRWALLRYDLALFMRSAWAETLCDYLGCDVGALRTELRKGMRGDA